MIDNVFADSACAAQKLTAALAAMGDWTLEIINRYDAAKGFMLLPRRWVGARTLAWSNRNRRLARRLSRQPAGGETWLSSPGSSYFDEGWHGGEQLRRFRSQTLRMAMPARPLYNPCKSQK